MEDLLHPLRFFVKSDGRDLSFQLEKSKLLSFNKIGYLVLKHIIISHYEIERKCNRKKRQKEKENKVKKKRAEGEKWVYVYIIID